ncbi:hypothetical protein KAU08_05320, partial [bacterium]|nr:hypothetical protein [bacterium]
MALKAWQGSTMKKDNLELLTYPDLYFIDKQKAERYFSFYSRNYPVVKQYLPKFKKLHAAIQFRYRDFKGIQVAFDEFNSIVRDYPHILIGVFLPCIFSPIIYTVFDKSMSSEDNLAHFIISFITLIIAMFFGLIIKSHMTKNSIKNIVETIENLPYPELISIKIRHVQKKIGDNFATAVTESGEVEIPLSDYEYYLANDKSDSIYRLSNAFEVV